MLTAWQANKFSGYAHVWRVADPRAVDSADGVLLVRRPNRRVHLVGAGELGEHLRALLRDGVDGWRLHDLPAARTPLKDAESLLGPRVYAMTAYTLLQRNLLYTAVTRAKRLVVLVGSRKALAIGVCTAGSGRRHSALTHACRIPVRPGAEPRAPARISIRAVFARPYARPAPAVVHAGNDRAHEGALCILISRPTQSCRRAQRRALHRLTFRATRLWPHPLVRGRKPST